jgi:hypothetical protein
MDIKLLSQLLFGNAADPATVFVAASRCPALLLPVGAVVGKISAFPSRMVGANKIGGLPLSMTFRIAKVLICHRDPILPKCKLLSAVSTCYLYFGVERAVVSALVLAFAALRAVLWVSVFELAGPNRKNFAAGDASEFNSCFPSCFASTGRRTIDSLISVPLLGFKRIAADLAYTFDGATFEIMRFLAAFGYVETFARAVFTLASVLLDELLSASFAGTHSLKRRVRRATLAAAKLVFRFVVGIKRLPAVLTDERHLGHEKTSCRQQLVRLSRACNGRQEAWETIALGAPTDNRYNTLDMISIAQVS